MEFKEIKKTLTQYAKYVIQQSRSNLTKGKHNSTKELYRSLGFELDQEKNAFLLEFLMEDYGAFQDKGVSGIKSSYTRKGTSVFNKNFKYGSGTGKKGGLTKGIDKWLRSKKFQWRNKKTGRFMSYQSMRYIIVRSIYNKGLRQTLFFSNPFNKGLQKYGNELVNAFALDLENSLMLGTKK
tara:strand:+ start:433 stop:975 length:543 start_codon:yes stop_codon:yes gene_type:complete